MRFPGVQGASRGSRARIPWSVGLQPGPGQEEARGSVSGLHASGTCRAAAPRSLRWTFHAAWAQGLEPAAPSVVAGLREGGSTSCARNGRQDKCGGEPGPGAHVDSSQGVAARRVRRRSGRAPGPAVTGVAGPRHPRTPRLQTRLPARPSSSRHPPCELRGRRGRAERRDLGSRSRLRLDEGPLASLVVQLIL